MWNVGNSLKCSFLRSDNFGGDGGNLRNIPQCGCDSLCVEVNANGWCSVGVCNEIGSVYIFGELFSHEALEPPFGPMMMPRY